MEDFTKREALAFGIALALAAVFVVRFTWFVIETFVLSDPRDPLTKAGGLKPEQDIHR
jgi:hypothetical protein